MSFIKGRVTKDAEVKQFVSGKEVVNFSVAVNEKYKQKNGEQAERVEYFNCAYWFNSGIAQVLKKGTLVEVSGWISAEAYMKGNDAKAKLVMLVQSVKCPFVPKKKEGSTGAIVQTSLQEGTDDLPF